MVAATRNGTKADDGLVYPEPKATVTLTFVEGEYVGIKVVCAKAGSMGLWEQMSEKLSADVYRRFGDEVLLSWNVASKDRKAVPANGEGMLAVDTDFAQATISAWIDAATGVADPLDDASSSGSTSLEDTTKTEEK